MRLDGKVALITGAGSGIGRATAVLFASEGAKIGVMDVSPDGAQATVSMIAEAGGEAITLIGDVSESDDAQHAARATVEAFGRLDILVNSAGITSRNAAPEGVSPESTWDRVMDVNLKGTYLTSWHAVPKMEASGGGSIVNLASIMGLVGYPAGIGGGFNPYPPSKGGVVQFTRTLAMDLASKGIRVNCLCPGFIATDMTRGLTEDADMLERLHELHPIGRLGRAEEIASVALYLASDDSAYVTGAALAVDGGYTAR